MIAFFCGQCRQNKQTMLLYGTLHSIVCTQNWCTTYLIFFGILSIYHSTTPIVPHQAYGRLSETFFPKTICSYLALNSHTFWGF